MSKIKPEDLTPFAEAGKKFINTALRIGNGLLKNDSSLTKTEVLGEFAAAAAQPESRLQGPYGEWARLWLEKQAEDADVHNFKLRDEPLDFALYGRREEIETTALQQMQTAMRLPVTLAGALMPDAHVGYGLPIGGVLATDANAVIPYAVGVDIACRMRLSIFSLPADALDKDAGALEKILLESTLFGIAGAFKQPLDDEIFERPEWNETDLLRSLKGKAYSQVGTSGTGNHFVEWGALHIAQDEPELGLPAGRYLSLLSHSGSRGFGANIANHYSKRAAELTKLPKEAQHLAWLNLDADDGREYWLSMNLAGDYAAANHRHIHYRVAKALKEEPTTTIENHHNFAWKQKLSDGRDALVHRKGATPAGAGELGVIPGSSVQPGFVVRGRGAADALQSASHGAGRVMSRNAAFQAITAAQVRNKLAEHGVKMIGGDIDEAPMVYKDIFSVMRAQTDLVDILATFSPRIVRMADPDRRKGARED